MHKSQQGVSEITIKIFGNSLKSLVSLQLIVYVKCRTNEEYCIQSCFAINQCEKVGSYKCAGNRRS